MRSPLQNPEPSHESGEDDKDSVGVEFAKQITKPRSEWSEDFQEFIDDQHARRFKETTQSSQEKESTTDVAERYLLNLGLSRGDLEGRKLIDLGCGEEARFVRYCLENNLGEKVVGIDKRMQQDIQDNYPESLYQGDLRSDVPEGEYDLAVANGVFFWQESPDTAEEIVRVLEPIIVNLLDKLTNAGELRIGPTHAVAPDSDHKSAKIEDLIWQKMLADIQKKMPISCQLKPTQMKVDRRKEPVLWQVAIMDKNEGAKSTEFDKAEINSKLNQLFG